MKIFKVLFGLALGAAMASQLAMAGEQPESPYERQKNLPAPLAGTHASRLADRQAHRAQVKEQVKAGEIPAGTGEIAGGDLPRAAPKGTRASRAAERKERADEVKALVKSGKVAASNEASTSN